MFSVRAFLSLAGEFGTESDSSLFKFLLVWEARSPYSSPPRWPLPSLLGSSRFQTLNAEAPQGPVIENHSSLFTFTAIYGADDSETLFPRWLFFWVSSRQHSRKSPFHNLASALLSITVSFFSSLDSPPFITPDLFFFLKAIKLGCFLRTFYLRFSLLGIFQTYFLHGLLSYVIQGSTQLSPPGPRHLKWQHYWLTIILFSFILLL